MKKIFLVIPFVILTSVVYSQCANFARYYFGGQHGEANVILELPDTSYMVFGTYDPSINNAHCFSMRINNCGDTLWTKRYSTGGSIIAATFFNDSQMVVLSLYEPQNAYRFNSTLININNGDTSSLTINLNLAGSWNGGYKTLSGNYILTSDVFFNPQYGIVKTDSNLNVIHNTTPAVANANLPIEDNAGNYYFYESAYSFPYYAVSKFDSSLVLKWWQRHGNMPNPNPGLSYWETGISFMADSNLLVSTNGPDYQLLKVNRNNGDTIWTRSLTDSASGYPYYFPLTKMTRIKNGNYAAVSMEYTNHNRLFMFDNNGDTLWTTTPVSIGCLGMIPTMDGGLIYFGYGWPGITGTPMAIVKLDSLGNTVFTSIAEFNSENEQPLFYPNPSNKELNINTQNFVTEKNIELTLTNMQGKQVLQQEYDKSKAVDVSNLPNGIYVAEVRGKEKVVRGKVAVQH